MAQNKPQGIVDAFVDGARAGWDIGVKSIIPYVVMAFIIIHLLNLLGALTALGNIFRPVMGLFGLPGEAMAALVAGWLSMGGGVGAAAALYTQGVLDGVHLSIVIVGIYLAGGLVQFVGRVLGAGDVRPKYFPHLILIALFNSFAAMFVMRVLVGILGN